MTGIAPATKAQFFMRQCRHRQNISVNTPNITRSVSSSHLAPSNFSKPPRARDPLPADQEPERRLPSSNPSSSSQPSQSTYQARSPFRTNSNNFPTAPITETIYPHVKNNFTSFIKYTILRLPLPKPNFSPPPFNVKNNPYRARKKWPPDFRTLHPTQQFHFEKLYRRRLLFKTNALRYDWNRYTKLLQHTLIVIALLYMVFIADPYANEGGGTPLDGFRAWFYGRLANLEGMPRDSREHAAELASYYKKNWALEPYNVLKAEAEQEAAEKKAREQESPISQDAR